MKPESWLPVAGLGTWVVSSSLTLGDIAAGRLAWDVSVPWLVAFGAFGAAFSLICWGPWRTGVMAIALLAVQAASALAMVALARDTLCTAMLVVVASQTPAYFPPSGAAAWTAAQTGLLALVLGRWYELGPALAVSAAFGGFQIFALATMLLAERERTARKELSLANRNCAPRARWSPKAAAPPSGSGSRATSTTRWATT